MRQESNRRLSAPHHATTSNLAQIPRLAGLFTHKADCQKLNDDELRGLPGAQCTFSARDTSRDDAALALLRSSCPAQADLTLKIGAQVILIKTLDAEAGLVNGARGVITKFLSTRNPSVRFDNGVEQTMRLEVCTPLLMTQPQ